MADDFVKMTHTYTRICTEARKGAHAQEILCMEWAESNRSNHSWPLLESLLTHAYRLPTNKAGLAQLYMAYAFEG